MINTVAASGKNKRSSEALPGLSVSSSNGQWLWTCGSLENVAVLLLVLIYSICIVAHTQSCYNVYSYEPAHQVDTLSMQLPLQHRLPSVKLDELESDTQCVKLSSKSMVHIFSLLDQNEEVDDDNSLHAEDDSLASGSNSTNIFIDELIDYDTIQTFGVLAFVIIIFHLIENYYEFIVSIIDSIGNFFGENGSKVTKTFSKLISSCDSPGVSQIGSYFSWSNILKSSILILLVCCQISEGLVSHSVSSHYTDSIEESSLPIVGCFQAEDQENCPEDFSHAHELVSPKVFNYSRCCKVSLLPLKLSEYQNGKPELPTKKEKGLPKPSECIPDTTELSPNCSHDVHCCPRKETLKAMCKLYLSKQIINFEDCKDLEDIHPEASTKKNFIKRHFHKFIWLGLIIITMIIIVFLLLPGQTFRPYNEMGPATSATSEIVIPKSPTCLADIYGDGILVTSQLTPLSHCFIQSLSANVFINGHAPIQNFDAKNEAAQEENTALQRDGSTGASEMVVASTSFPQIKACMKEVATEDVTNDSTQEEERLPLYSDTQEPHVEGVSNFILQSSTVKYFSCVKEQF